MAAVAPQTFYVLGNEIMRRRRRVGARTAMSRFRATFGTSWDNCARLWSMILESAGELPPGAKPVHLLWALMFLKLYCSESVLSSLAGGVDEKTFRKWAWYFSEQISNLQYDLIRWDDRFEGDVGNICLVSVDGTDFQIYQLQPFWTGWYSHKFKGPGVRYEVAVCIMTGEIVWFYGPFPCGRWPDIKIFRRALKWLLSDGEKVVADKGYRGEAGFIITPTGDVSEDVGKAARGRHETVNERFKQWGILHRVCRHSIDSHQTVFSAVAVITQVALRNGEPLFGVEYDDSELA